jgi:hypothetical protein
MTHRIETMRAVWPTRASRPTPEERKFDAPLGTRRSWRGNVADTQAEGPIGVCNTKERTAAAAGNSPAAPRQDPVQG